MAGCLRQRLSHGRIRLEDVAAERLKSWKAEKARVRAKSLPLVEYVHDVSPQLDPPDHLRPYAEILEKACPRDGEPGDIRVVVAAPPQHGKTELTLRAFLWWAIRAPGKRHAYVTYNAERALTVARNFLLLAELSGLEPTGILSEIRLKGGTTIKFTSIGGSLTGYPIDGVCVVDDPIKDSTEAQSATVRQRCIDWFDTVAWTRRHAGTSYVIMATRWHPEDLSGILIGRGWRYVNLKAIAEGPANDNGAVQDDPLGRRPGEALWPSHKPVEFFDEERKNEYWWASLYQGEPRPRGAKLFRDPIRYTKLPRVYRVGYGVDLAYTAKTQRDFSVCIELWREDRPNELPLFYVVEVDRRQVQAPDFSAALKAKLEGKGAPLRWYAYGPELGIGDFLRRDGLYLQALPARGDKFVRAQDVAAAWNDGRVLVPHEAPWLAAFLDELREFTGVGDLHDDQVDALGAAFDLLNESFDDNTIIRVPSARA
ncbi:MAG: hypothetical protein AMXMBFR56_65600 [Polyangiaceae bacterium]